jgi:hypothetical protein
MTRHREARTGYARHMLTGDGETFSGFSGFAQGKFRITPEDGENPLIGLTDHRALGVHAGMPGIKKG